MLSKHMPLIVKCHFLGLDLESDGLNLELGPGKYQKVGRREMEETTERVEGGERTVETREGVQGRIRKGKIEGEREVIPFTQA